MGSDLVFYLLVLIVLTLLFFLLSRFWHGALPLRQPGGS
jgi:hypothetical protein